MRMFSNPDGASVAWLGANLVPRILLFAGLLAVGAISVMADDNVLPALKAQYKRPLTIPFGGQTDYSPQLATLGKMLFFDPRLSGAQNISCANCHNPSFGWEVPMPGAVGAQNTSLARHSPTVLNAAWKTHEFWDGRMDTLEQQAAGPVTGPSEMNGNFDQIGTRLSAVPEYKHWFEVLFPGKSVNQATVTTALATYERTIVAGWSPFDRWIDGDEGAIPDTAKHGFMLFTGTAGCAACHSGWNFTDDKFHDIGLPGTDVGRAKVEPDNPKAMFAFKTPGLRNVMNRAPFMHDGSLPDLTAVLAHYESSLPQRPSLDAAMKPVVLTHAEEQDLIAFLASLTADEAAVPTPVLPTN